ncbi:MAG: penicillin acylase family protein [Candidatus Dormibacteria bacterium]
MSGRGKDSALTQRLRDDAQRAAAMMSGRLDLPGLAAPVRVLRDQWGVPHIYAESLEDLFMTQGFVMAADRLFQIDITLRMAQGRLAELVGERAIGSDRWVRQMGLHRFGERASAEGDALSAAMSGAWARGVRAWIDRLDAAPAEYDLFGGAPTFPGEGDAPSVIAAAWVGFTCPTTWPVKVVRAALAEAAGWEAVEILMPGSNPPPSGTLAAGRLRHPVVRGGTPEPSALAPIATGSNNWVVSGRWTKSGLPMVANDSHRPTQDPSGWYECHLVAPGLNVSGVTLPTVPGIVTGHTPTTAWAITDVGGDAYALYEERLDPAGVKALYDGRWEALGVAEERINVRGRSEPVIVPTRRTRNGSLLDVYPGGNPAPAGSHHSLRWPGEDTWFNVSTFVTMAQARTFDQFRDALRGWTLLGEHTVFANTEGEIGYQLTGVFPLRAGLDTGVPLRGWEGADAWQGVVPFDQLPWSHNPTSGVIATANHRTYPPSYPHTFGTDHSDVQRATRIVERISEHANHTVASFGTIQGDQVSLRARRLLPLLLDLEPTNVRQAEALALLGAWDADLGAGSAAAAVYQLWVRSLFQALTETHLDPQLAAAVYSPAGAGAAAVERFLSNPIGEWLPEPGAPGRRRVLSESLDTTLTELTARLGPKMQDWSWGAVHQIRFPSILGPLLGDDLPDAFVGDPIPIGGDRDTVNPSAWSTTDIVPGHHASWRHIVDLGDVDGAVGAQPPGQCANPTSPHAHDQLELWHVVAYHPRPISLSAVEAVTASRLELQPAPTEAPSFEDHS